MPRRFLAPKARPGNGLGYVDNPEMGMRHEPEALTAEEYELHIDKRAKAAAEQQRKFEDAQREKERRLMTFDQRLAKAQHEASKRRMDVSSDVRLIRMMQSGRKKLRHLETRLGQLERKVFREDRP